LTNIEQPQPQHQTPQHGGPWRDPRVWASVLSTAARIADFIARITGWHL